MPPITPRQDPRITLGPKEAQLLDLDLDIIDQLVRGQQERFGGLAGDIRGRGEEFVSGISAERTSRLEDLAGLLEREREEAFDISRPEILEDLERRGLLHSSAVGEEFARERGRLTRESENILRRQALQDVDFEQQLLSDLLGRELGATETGVRAGADIETSVLPRIRGLGDFRLQADLAQSRADQEAARRTSAQKRGLFGQLLGTGATVAGLGLLGAFK